MTEQSRPHLQRLLPHVTPAARWQHPNDGAWLNVGLTYAGLQRLGLPQASLDSFAPEMRAGMAARAAILSDTGDSAPAHWERPLGSGDVHVALALFAATTEDLQGALGAARAAQQTLPGVTLAYQQDVGMLPNGRTQLGYHDGISNPIVEGSGRVPSPGERVIKAGEFLFGYPDESGVTPPMPQPAVLGHNGSYFAYRKLHMRVAAFRSYLRSVAANAEDEALLAAKLIGRWPSGAPLVLAPTQDDPALGADPQRLRLQDRRPPGGCAARSGPTSGGPIPATSSTTRWSMSTSTACCGVGLSMARRCRREYSRTTGLTAALSSVTRMFITRHGLFLLVIVDARQALPEAQSGATTTAQAVADTLSARAGKPLPWSIVRDAISSALRAQYLELAARARGACNTASLLRRPAGMSSL
jgi:deferrochelatase/peroxidase EfeB